ncbi:putative uncharacterized protein DDB_G0277255 [Galleria mellonella]|uniref:Uncharacterized protein n=1 Tax=Galleria mellonella TaxID=7137 RepID=A0ABM3MSK0_GALME|nr:putative uncharacterized protein DDB_G0277255 [Galleria mellonella]
MPIEPITIPTSGLQLRISNLTGEVKPLMSYNNIAQRLLLNDKPLPPLSNSPVTTVLGLSSSIPSEISRNTLESPPHIPMIGSPISNFASNMPESTSIPHTSVFLNALQTPKSAISTPSSIATSPAQTPNAVNPFKLDTSLSPNSYSNKLTSVPSYELLSQTNFISATPTKADVPKNEIFLDNLSVFGNNVVPLKRSPFNDISSDTDVVNDLSNVNYPSINPVLNFGKSDVSFCNKNNNNNLFVNTNGNIDNTIYTNPRQQIPNNSNIARNHITIQDDNLQSLNAAQNSVDLSLQNNINNLCSTQNIFDRNKFTSLSSLPPRCNKLNLNNNIINRNSVISLEDSNIVKPDIQYSSAGVPSLQILRQDMPLSNNFEPNNLELYANTSPKTLKNKLKPSINPHIISSQMPPLQKQPCVTDFTVLNSLHNLQPQPINFPQISTDKNKIFNEDIYLGTSMINKEANNAQDIISSSLTVTNSDHRYEPINKAGIVSTNLNLNNEANNLIGLTNTMLSDHGVENYKQEANKFTEVSYLPKVNAPIHISYPYSILSYQNVSPMNSLIPPSLTELANDITKQILLSSLTEKSFKEKTAPPTILGISDPVHYTKCNTVTSLPTVSPQSVSSINITPESTNPTSTLLESTKVANYSYIPYLASLTVNLVPENSSPEFAVPTYCPSVMYSPSYLPIPNINAPFYPPVPPVIETPVFKIDNKDSLNLKKVFELIVLNGILRDNKCNALKARDAILALMCTA